MRLGSVTAAGIQTFFAGDRCTPIHTERDLSEGTGATAPTRLEGGGFYTSRKAGKLILGVRALGVWCVVLDYFFGDDEDCFRIEIIFNFSKVRARVRDAMTPARQLVN